MSSRENRIDPKELVDALRRFEPLIPDYTQLTNEQIIALRRAATLSQDWVLVAVNAIGASPPVEAVVRSTHGELLHEIDDIGRWSEVEQQLRKMLKGVMAANLIRRHRIGLTALQAYGIIRQLVRQPEHHILLPYYERLRQMNKLGKRKKKEPEEEEMPEPLTE
jgi:hypothetical protein